MRTTVKVASQECPFVGLTEHVVDAHTRILTVLNYTPREQSSKITMDGWNVETVYIWGGGKLEDWSVTLPGNAGMVIVVKK